MAGGWAGSVGADDVDAIQAMLQGDDDQSPDGNLPRGFAGMTPTSIATGNTTDCDCPLWAFIRMKRLVLNPASLVDLSYVQDLKVGTISLNIGKQPVPCAAFARDAVGTYIDAAVWASPSVYPTVRIYNNTGGTIVYSGGVFGSVSLVKPEGVKVAS